MGYIRHNAIIVTSWKPLDAIVEKAYEIGLHVIGPAVSFVNGFDTLLIGPDGSKEGWEESKEGDRRRAHFKDYLRTYRYEDGSSPLAWVEISYGSDDREAVVNESEWTPAASVNDTNEETK